MHHNFSGTGLVLKLLFVWRHVSISYGFRWGLEPAQGFTQGILSPFCTIERQQEGTFAVAQPLDESTASESSITSLPDEGNIPFFLTRRSFGPSRAQTDKQIDKSLSVCPRATTLTGHLRQQPPSLRSVCIEYRLIGGDGFPSRCQFLRRRIGWILGWRQTAEFKQAGHQQHPRFGRS